MTQRISEWMFQRPDGNGLMIKILPWQDRTDKGAWQGETAYVLKDLWSTYNGSWQYQNDSKWTPPQWAIQDYLKPVGDPMYFDDAGGDHHLFGAAIGLDGRLQVGKGLMFGSDGLQLANPAAWAMKQAKQSGFANVELWSSSTYFPDQGKAGPWAWWPVGLSDICYGAGMPYQHHVSTFGVWQEVLRSDPVDPGTGGTGTATPELLTELALLRAEVARAATAGESTAKAVQDLLAFIRGGV